MLSHTKHSLGLWIDVAEGRSLMHVRNGDEMLGKWGHRKSKRVSNEYWEYSKRGDIKKPIHVIIISHDAIRTSVKHICHKLVLKAGGKS